MLAQQTCDDVSAPAQPPRYFWQIYELFNIHDTKFDGVSFSAMLQQFPKVIGLFVVVAFGSSLDVAAIQADSPEPLDYNHELKTVGEASLSIGLLMPCGINESWSTMKQENYAMPSWTGAHCLHSLPPGAIHSRRESWERSVFQRLASCNAGLSNTVTALTGAGLTGSYIFSQTIFSMRAGVHTRIHGAIIAGSLPTPPASLSLCISPCQP